MSKSKAAKELMWRERLALQTSSGKSVLAFCRDESISVSNFYAWRLRLKGKIAKADLPARTSPAPFIHLGTLNDTPNQAVHQPTPLRTSLNTGLPTSSINVQLDLGNGMVLTITRH
jgi:hypothetical protein